SIPRLSSISDAWGRLNVVTPFHHLSGGSHLHRSLGAGPITASSTSMPRMGSNGSTKALRPSPIANVSGTAGVNRDPPICEISPQKNWKRARLPTPRHAGEPIGTGAANSRCGFSAGFRAVRASVPQPIPLRRPLHPAHRHGRGPPRLPAAPPRFRFHPALPAGGQQDLRVSLSAVQDRSQRGERVAGSFGALVQLALLTGMRRGELSQLQRDRHLLTGER